MPRTRALVTYSNRQFIALCEKVLASGEPFTVPCSRAQAASLRGELYAWRRAAEADPSDALALGVPWERLRDLAWRITDAGLETIPANMLVGPNLIELALGGAVPPLESPAMKALKALQANLAGEEPPSGS